ncbi:MAG: hypothetical protein K2H53_05400 [Clostridia bacterium]|nr:hypothetical protein [Clostridia bacterium]
MYGDRTFKIEPLTQTMRISDTEDIEITGNPFNVFGNKEISVDNYDFEIDDEAVITRSGKTLTAIDEGIAHITVTDKVTKEQIVLTRIVLSQELDRIAKITVNGEIAGLADDSTAESLKYYVKIVTNSDTAQLRIDTNKNTDKIAINNEWDDDKWSNNGQLNRTIDLSGKYTYVPIKVAAKNNQGEYNFEVDYILTIEKVTDDIALKEIFVTSMDNEGVNTDVKAKAVSINRYEVVVGENTDLSKITAIANSEYSYVSIDGLEYTISSQEKDISLGKNLTVEYKIAVKSEAGREAEYTLVIYKESAALELITLTVNDINAVKLNDAEYAVTVPKETNIGNVKAILNSDLASLNIDGGAYSIKQATKAINLTSEETKVIITAKTDDGYSKEYQLTIYKEIEDGKDPKLDMLIVNGIVTPKEADGETYIAYLPSTTIDADVRAIAKEEDTWVEIEGKGKQLKESLRNVLVSDNENTYKIVLTNDEGGENEYTLIIRKAEADTSLDEVYVTTKEDKTYDATKVDDTNYTVKVPGNITELDVTGITGYAKSEIEINDNGIYKIHKNTQNIVITSEETEVVIRVKSEDGIYTKEYPLTIIRMSNNAELFRVTVEGIDATFDETDGNYHYVMKSESSTLEVKAYTDAKAPIPAYVNIDNGNYELYEVSKDITIVPGNTTVKIKVKAEDGTTKTHTLIIEGLPDDATIKQVTVNGIDAKYIEGQNRYEAKADTNSFEIDVTLNDSLARMTLGTNPEAIGHDSATVTKAGDETIVNCTVISQSGFITEKYTIVIIPKSENNNLDIVKVNGNVITVDTDGKYKAYLPHNTAVAIIEGVAEDTYAKTNIDGVENNSYIASAMETVIDGQDTYIHKIYVTSETGETKEYDLEIYLLEADYTILNVFAGKDAEHLEEATVDTNGNYYYKIDRVDTATVKVDLASPKSSVRINGELGNVVEVDLPNDITKVPIIVIGEDKTEKLVYLTIEKKSNDTGILSVTGEHVLNTSKEENLIYVGIDEDYSEVDLKITLNNKFGKLRIQKPEGEVQDEFTNYELETHVVLETSGNTLINVLVKAEDRNFGRIYFSIIPKTKLGLNRS